MIRLPRISNATDVEALACEPGVSVRFVTEPSRLADADLVVLPGSKATVDDLGWLRETGLREAIQRFDGPVLGICGGFQMLAGTIEDDVESREGVVAGLGLLDVDIRFQKEKTLARPSGTVWGEDVTGYEIHHGQVVRSTDPPLIGDEGAQTDRVLGTHWHGLLENDGFRRKFLLWAAERAGRDFVPGEVSFQAAREAQLDLLGDLVADHLDTKAVIDLLERGAPRGLPFVPPGAPPAAG